MQETILIIEDDREIAGVVALNLEDLGLKTEHVTDGRMGLQKALDEKYALIILDIMLPGLDGLSLCRRLREQNPYTPVLMLTAKSEEIDRVLGLEIGADDYLTKPFSIRELVARVKALLRRSHLEETARTTADTQAVIRFEDFTVDPAKRRVILAGEPLELTVKEFELLNLFLRNPGRAYSRTDLLKLIWGYQYTGYEHTVNSHINRLRMKIEKDPGHPRYLKTVWGIGYRFTELSELDGDRL